LKYPGRDVSDGEAFTVLESESTPGSWLRCLPIQEWLMNHTHRSRRIGGSHRPHTHTRDRRVFCVARRFVVSSLVLLDFFEPTDNPIRTHWLHFFNDILTIGFETRTNLSYKKKVIVGAVEFSLCRFIKFFPSII